MEMVMKIITALLYAIKCWRARRVYRQASARSRRLHLERNALDLELLQALKVERLRGQRMEEILNAEQPGACKMPALSKHDSRRLAWLEIFAIYGFFIGLAVWNWW
jgi:hypothetical protein